MISVLNPIRACTVALAASCALWATTAHGEDFRLQFPPILTMSPHGVNLQTGRFELTQKEFSIGPLSVDLRWTGAYSNELYKFPTTVSGQQVVDIGHPANGIARSLRGFLKMNSVNTSTGSSFLVIDVQLGDKMLRFALRGTSSNFEYDPWNIAASGWRLSKSGTNFILTNASGDVYTFIDHTGIPSGVHTEKPKMLSSAVYADGHRLDYSYGSTAELRTVISNRGYAVVLDYAPATATITACGYNMTETYVSTASTCAAAPIKTSYGFTTLSGGVRLTSVTDVNGNVSTWTYTGHNSQFVSCFSLPNSAACRLQNFTGPQPGDPEPGVTESDQVRKQITATGDIWTYNYTNPVSGDMPPIQPGEVRYTYSRMTDPLSNLTTAKYGNGLIEEMNSPAGKILYTFNGLCPMSITYPEGNSLQVTSQYNCTVTSQTEKPKSGSPLSATTKLFSFPPTNIYTDPLVCNAASPKLCDKPVYQIDERGNRTDFTYDPAHGGVLTETGPAVNGVRPQKRYTYAQRYAWVKNSAGAYVQAATPVWVLTQESICKTGAASGSGCAVAGDEVITQYDYGPNSGPNNLNLRGKVVDPAGLALRTCFAYDPAGNKVSETSPKAGLTGCP